MGGGECGGRLTFGYRYSNYVQIYVQVASDRVNERKDEDDNQ